jgi:hypothetical protein
MNETEREQLIDRRVQARMQTDRDYLFAETAEEQAIAEHKIELQEERAVLIAAGYTIPANTRRIEDIDAEIERLYQDWRKEREPRAGGIPGDGWNARNIND